MTQFHQLFLIVVLIVSGLAAGAWILATEPAKPLDAHATGESEHEVDNHEHHEMAGHAESDEVNLTAKQVSAAGLETEIAGPMNLQRSLRINGVIVPNQERLSAITARFAGVVRSVAKRVGDPVNKGDSLVRVESNESLTVYSIASPLSGTILARDVAVGESVNTDRKLFLVADLSTVWVELGLHSADISHVQPGQTAMIRLGDSAPVPSKITFLSPLTSISTQTVTARAVLDNDGGRFRPGMFVTADVLTAVVPVAVAIKQEAIQEIDGKRVVFLRKGDGEFVVREVELGERDQRMVEVLFGVVAGDTYVTQNSFVLKAELGKAAAEHAH